MPSLGSHYSDWSFDHIQPQSVPVLYGRARTNSSLILAREQTRDMCCVYGPGPPSVTRVVSVVPLTTGVCLALMSPINSALRTLLGSGTWPALLSYGVSLCLSCVVCVSTRCLRPGRLRVVRKFVRRHPANMVVLLGGVLGLLPVLADTFAPEVIGVGMLSVGVVAGQTALSVIADRLGLFWRRPYSLPWPIWAGFVAVVCGAVVYRIDSILEFQSSPHSLLLQLAFTGLAVLSGVARTSQTALNRKLAPLMGRHRDALCFNYAIGTVIMAAVVPCVDRSPKFNHTLFARDWWKYSSGVLSLVSQVLGILGTKLLGMTKSVVIQVAAQICCATIIDHLGLLGVAKRPLSVYNVLGVTTVLIGVLLADMDIPHLIDDNDEA